MPRSGFTLVEMLVVIIVIAILISLLVPAISRARRSANIAAVVTDIKQLETAIQAFKIRFGMEPPSRITIYTNLAGWNSDPTSKATIARIWPQFDFTMTNAAGQNQGYTYPQLWGAPGSSVSFNSGECLLFFLGGIMEQTDPTSGLNGAPTGFAKNPAFPFSPQFQLTGPQMTSRDSPFIDFAKSKLRIVDTDGNKLCEYVDPIPNQTMPYLYFSSYEGRGYRVTGATSELPAGGTLLDVYRQAGSTVPDVVGSGPTGTSSLIAWKAQSFQIISPGYDGHYGVGGTYDADKNLQNASGNSLLVNGLHLSSDNQPHDQDNITNFSSGELAR